MIPKSKARDYLRGLGKSSTTRDLATFGTPNFRLVIVDPYLQAGRNIELEIAELKGGTVKQNSDEKVGVTVDAVAALMNKFNTKR